MFSARTGSMLYPQNRPKRTNQPFNFHCLDPRKIYPGRSPSQKEEYGAAVLHRDSTALRSNYREWWRAALLNTRMTRRSLALTQETTGPRQAIPHGPAVSEAHGLDDS
jgi:hypothetical protein